MSEVNKDLVRRHFQQIWNVRNLDACDEMMAVDFVEHAPAPFATNAPGRVNGPEAMRETVRWLTKQFPDIHFGVESIVADGDLVVARVISEGTNTGRLNGVLPPSGKAFRAVQCHWFRVQNGKLAEHWAVRDDLTAMLQLGVVTSPRLGAARRQLGPAIRFWARSRHAERA